MRHVTCSHCNRTDVPVNESLHIDEVVYCHNCVNTTFTEDQLKGRTVVNEFDPTVCSNCSKDFGDTTLEKVAQYPMCPECTKAIHEKSFPTWVKAFFIGILVVVVFSAVYNWRFVEGYKEIQAGGKAMGMGDYKGALASFEAAARHVPEQKDFEPLIHFCRGVTFLQDDHSAAALPELEACLEFMPPGYNASMLITQAQIGAAFDTKDYGLFLQHTKNFLQNDTTQAISWAGVASAYACLYATSKADSLKDRYIAYRTKALSIADSANQNELAVYINRLDHRIETGDIITAKQFSEKFPNGWAKN